MTRSLQSSLVLGLLAALAASCQSSAATAADASPVGRLDAVPSPAPSDPRVGPPALSNSPSPRSDARVASAEVFFDVLPPTTGAGPTVASEAGAETAPEGSAEVGKDLLADLMPAPADTGQEVRSALPEVAPDLATDPRAPDREMPEAGREVAPDTRVACLQSCFEGCNVGCGAGNQCVSCATCTCEVVTGSCHC